MLLVVLPFLCLKLNVGYVYLIGLLLSTNYKLEMHGKAKRIGRLAP